MKRRDILGYGLFVLFLEFIVMQFVPVTSPREVVYQSQFFAGIFIVTILIIVFLVLTHKEKK